MANTEVGSAFLSIIPSMKGFDGKVFSGITAGLATAAAATAAAIGGVSKAAIDAYSNFEQLEGGVQTIFGNASKQVMQDAAEAYKVSGVSMNQYMSQINSFGAALKQSLGGDVQQAAKFGNLAIKDMADNASIFGTNLQDVQNAYQGFAKQNYTMLDNLKLGYGGTKSEMQRLIKDANELEKAQGRAGDLTIEKYSDVIQAIHDVQEAQNITGNSAREASHTIQGSIQTMQAAWENWLSALADPSGDIEGMTQKLVESIGQVAQNLLPIVANVAKNMANALPSVIQAAVPAMADIVGTLVTGIDWIGIAGSIASALQNAFGMAADLITQIPDFAGKIFGLITEQLQNSPFDFSGFTSQLAPLADAISGLFQAAKDAIDEMAQNGALQNIMTLAGNVGGLIVAIVINIINCIKAVLPAVAPVVNFVMPILSFIASALTHVVNIVGTVVAAVAGAVGRITAFVANLLSSFVSSLGGIKGAWDRLIGFLSGAASRIAGFFSSIPSKIGGFFNGALNAAKNAGRGILDFFRGIPKSIGDFFSSIPGKIAAMFKNIHVPTLHIEGGFDLNPLHFRLPKISFYAKGGIVGPAFGGPQLGVVGEARHNELITPLEGRAMHPFADYIASRIGGNSDMTKQDMQDAVASALAEVMPYIISQYTPVLSQREQARLV